MTGTSSYFLRGGSTWSQTGSYVKPTYLVAALCARDQSCVDDPLKVHRLDAPLRAGRGDDNAAPGGREAARGGAERGAE